MADDFDNHYDITDGDGAIDQEEAFFYHVIAEFQDCIEKYGCAFVLSKLNSNVKLLIKEKLNV
jgi:hypothetical protein